MLIETLTMGATARTFDQLFPHIRTISDSRKTLLCDATACGYSHPDDAHTTISVTILVTAPWTTGTSQSESATFAERVGSPVELALQRGSTGKTLTVNGKLRLVGGSSVVRSGYCETYEVTGPLAEWE